jgi:hypothetical protein
MPVTSPETRAGTTGTARRPHRWRSLLAALVAVAATATSFVALTESAAAAPAGYPIWADTTRPAQAAATDSSAVELGVKFRSNSDGYITALRYYRMSGEPAATRATLWSSGGSVLARTSYSSPTSSGWQTVALATPVAVKANTDYVSSYTAPGGRYAADQGTLSSTKTVANKNLTATAGVYDYGMGFPTRSYASSNYYADVMFSATATGSGSTTTTAPTTTTPTTTAPSTSSGTKPGSTNTGVPSSVSLKSSGSLTITTPNTVIDGYNVSGGITVQASGVVIKNTKVSGSGTYGIYVRSGSATITDTDITGSENAIAGDNWTATRVDIYGTYGDGVKLGSNVTLQDSWIHDLTPSAGAHADGGQMQSGVTNLVVKNNNIDLAKSTNAALFLAPDLGPSSNGPVTITGNWLNGGNYTLYCLDGNNGQYYVKNISITNNKFGRTSNYGPSRINVPVTQSGNVWADTLAALSL